ncbi:transmembrane and ubiquitin-like domain-containing protein 1 isoform X2 [Plodia interpunctella]|uniref:transmembrane and ubiquitin-like domain-containing protein 1 isoform X2 n=1 Tax=Plodia interpunctella TaxID=58824 RepID=UPI002368C820|nr:transmembrane and ubiquitin-like domain-containing protein 1 isoform X2 [Plodia interpunctella]
MTLIEGVGDEVVQFVGVLLVSIVAALAWWSTNARPDRYHTVLVMRSRAHHPVTVSIRTRSNMPITNAPGTIIEQASTSNANGTSSIPTETNEDNPGESSRVIPLQEMDSIVDADMAMLDNNRLHFYRRIDSGPHNSGPESTSDESESQDDVEPASNAQIREMDSIVSAMEADVTAGCDFFSTPSGNKTVTNDGSVPSVSSANTPSEENTPQTAEASGDATDGNSRKILIKLKYLNDTLKEVEGSLDELLKDFKWRHFSSELSSECRVRLIFNGRVLGDDAATLRALGLHHRAVVHCLVHPRSHPPQNRNSPRHSSPSLVLEGAPERPWDLENIFMTLVSVALTVVWFFRCEYSNMFTASASVALFGLTVFYSVAIFGLYLSDTFHNERRPQPLPNN